MIKKNDQWPFKKKEPRKFIPRRDLFPDAVVPPEWELTDNFFSEKNKPGNVVSIAEHKRKTETYPVNTLTKEPEISYLSENRPLIPVNSKSVSPHELLTYILILFGAWLLLEFIGSRNKSITFLTNPKSIDILKSLGPYLNEKEQKAAYTAAGVLEAAHLMKNVMNDTYRYQHSIENANIASNPGKRALDAIKALKPYINPNDRRYVSQAIDIFERIDKLNRNIMLHRNNMLLMENKRTNPISSAGDILKIVHPILPKESRKRADKAIQVLNIIELMEETEKLNLRNRKKNEKSVFGKNIEVEKQVKDTKDKEDMITDTKSEESNEDDKTDQADQIQNIIDSLSPMLNEEQKESMGMILKLAQLLTQSENDTETDSD